MRYNDFYAVYHPKLVFSLHEIQLFEPNFDRRRLYEWQQKGYITKITNGWYFFSDYEIFDDGLFTIANKIYEPSYISLESALAYHGLIPEGVMTITSVSSKKTKQIKTPIGNFSYQTIKPKQMQGYEVIRYQNLWFKIAYIEKAIADYLYLNKYFNTEADFAESRIDWVTLKEQRNIELFRSYIQKYDEKTLTKRAESFISYYEVNA